MKLLSKIKFIIVFINISLVVCGIFFLGGYFKKTPIECKTIEKVNKEQQEQKHLVEDFAMCQSELFTLKNQVEQLKTQPDTRKDIIKLLILARNTEKYIGQKKNFSNECVKIFAIASRVPVVQEYILKYKDGLFHNNCHFYDNEEIIKMILPFQIKFLQQQREIENKNTDEKILTRVWNGIKYYATKLFVSSNIKKSDLEIAIENYDYQEATNFLNNGNFEKNNEFNQLYEAIVDLKNFKQMLEQIYVIIDNNM